MKIRNVWIDLDNSPHVLIFRPIIGELQARGVNVSITARDFAQTIQLLELYGISFKKIGRHGGKNKIYKILNLLHRAFQLYQYARKKTFDLALSHGSRTQLIAAKFLSIQSILMLDYEYTEHWIFNNFSTYLLIPKHIPDLRLKQVNFNLAKIIRYNGFKEEIYLPDFKADRDFRLRLNIDKDKILIVIRPPGMVGNYHDSLSEKLFLLLLDKILLEKNAYPLVVSRTKEDRQLIYNKYNNKVKFLEKTVDGIQLIWNSDIFISGGGTMNRESALLGIPTYSIFTGRKPFLDLYLENLGKLTFIDSLDKIKLLKITKRKDEVVKSDINTNLVTEIADVLQNLG